MDSYDLSIDSAWAQIWLGLV